MDNKKLTSVSHELGRRSELGKIIYVSQTSMTFKDLKQIRNGSLMKDRVKQKLENGSVSKAKPGHCTVFP